jgi:hypothetical protein
MFNITNHWGNANQNSSWVPLHTYQDVFLLKKTDNSKHDLDVEKMETSYIASKIKMVLENCLVTLQKVKHMDTI